MRAVLAILVMGSACGLAIFGRSVPNELWQAAALVLGLYFGARGTEGGVGK